MSAPSNRNYGFVKRLLTWAASAAMVVTAVSAAALFYVTYEKAYDEQDDLLEEVSGVLARIDVSNKHPGALWMDDDDFEDWFIVDDDSPQSIAKAGSTILVRTLHKGGQTIRVVFDKDLHDGAQTLSIGDTDYRLYLITLSNGKHIAVAQKTKEIEKLARQAALAATLPLLGLSVTFFIILALLLWFAVKPIKSLTGEINRRKPDDVTPIDPRELPSELLPMVDAFNGVLKRIDELRQSESRFVADAAHELRSPLAALSLQAERLEKAAVSDEAKKQILWGLEKADIVKISDNEVEFLWNCDEKTGAEKLLNDFNVKLAMITLGPKGCYLANKNHSIYMTCPNVKPIDTTGAGDIFGGSAISQVLKLNKNPLEFTEQDLLKIAAFASTASSLSTEIRGGIPSIPDIEKVNHSLAIRGL